MWTLSWFLLISQFIFIQCYIPNLTVKKLDGNLIKRKRQDTLDMCRIFNAEYKDNVSSAESLNANNVLNKGPLNDGKILKERLKRDTYFADKRSYAGYDDSSENKLNATEKTTSTTPSSGVLQEFAPAVLLGPKTAQTLQKNDTDEVRKVPWTKIWPHGIVPYYIDQRTYDNHLVDIIMKAFDYFEKTTCIRLQRLRERPTDIDSLQKVDWLYISNPTGIRQCVHTNDQKPNSGVQMTVFGYDCMKEGEIVHELMHVLGFPHEHIRSDRDKNIEIVWDNIKPGYKKYFEKRNDSSLLHMPYDTYSIMHYPQRAFSKNGNPTITTLDNSKIGQREALSEIDIEKINYVYAYECLERNKIYLEKTCPTVIDSAKSIEGETYNTLTLKDIQDYFRNRIWRYAQVNYRFKDVAEFSVEERENIAAVIRHIETESCIKFVNMDEQHEDKVIDDYSEVGPIATGKNIRLKREGKSPNQKIDTLKVGGKNRAASKENEVNGNIAKKPLDIERKGMAMYTGRPFRSRKIKKHMTSSRRHTEQFLIFIRSEEVGCKCPPPGRPATHQVLNISSECFNSVNDLLHLFLHVLGLDHQHNMHDRDSYIKILWDNISTDISTEMKEKLPRAASVGFPYDYHSVMHYPWLQIKNGHTNIMYPIWNDGWAMGHWQGLSAIDVRKLDIIYKPECMRRKLLYASA